MDAKVTWQKGLSFTGTADTGFELPLGADPSVGGANDGFRPIELMAISLAGCTAMDVLSVMKKKQQDVSSFDVLAHVERESELPQVFKHATITYRISGHHLDETALRRSIELSVTKYCPAYAMLVRLFPIEMVYELYEDLEGQGSELVKHGTYQLPDTNN